jgi:hypothetical protein
VVARKLAADARGRSTQSPRDGSNRFPCGNAAGDLLSLAEPQSARSSTWRHRRQAASLLDDVVNALLGHTQRAPNLTERVALLPPPPNFFLLRGP